MCSVSTVEFSQIASQQVVKGALWMSVYLQQVLDQLLPYEINLITSEQRLCEQCGGYFPPSTYLVNGIIERVSPIEVIDEEPRFAGNLVVDCGFPLLIGQRLQPLSRYLIHVQKGDWIGAIGEIYLVSDEFDWTPKVMVRPIECFLLDFRPQSPSFSKIIPWQFGQSLPHDPDVLRFPSVFVSCEVLG